MNSRIRFLIRDFGNNTSCDSIVELERRLKLDYCGKHVAIHRMIGDRTVGIHYVAVRPSEGVFDSYGEQKRLDFSVLDRQ